jgi:ribosomal protein L6P/L9E
MYYKLKYSSLLSLKKKNNSVLYLKGPLGINYLKVPVNIKVIIDNSNQIITFSYLKVKKGKKKNLSGFLSIFYNSCRTLVFGDLVGLNIQGLGLKFLQINNLSLNKKYLSMSLGYSDPVNYIINNNRSIFFFKDIRNIFIYSTDYSYLRNEVSKLTGLKKPNKFIKRENGIRINKNII